MSTLKVNTIRHTGASSDAVTLASDGTCTVKATNKSNRNLIINGDCRIHQRGNLSFTNSPHARTYGGPDRFYQYMYASSEEARYDFKRATGPADKGFEYCAHLDVTTADTSIHADHAVWTGYKVEANDCQGLFYGTSDAKDLTLSFWIKSSVTGTYSLRVAAEDWDDYYVTTYTVSSADTWEKKTITIPGDQRAGKGLTIDNSSGIEIKWIWAAGTNRVGTPNQWATGGTEFGASGITAANIFSSTDNNLYLTGVQLEVGDVATDFEYRSYSDELLRCQRYCMKWEGQNTGGNHYRFPAGIITADTTGSFPISHSVPMRAVENRAISHGIAVTSSQAGGGGNQSPPTMSLDIGGCGTMSSFVHISNLGSGRSNGDFYQTRVGSDNDWWLIVENEL